jgi:hypothetical protein
LEALRVCIPVASRKGVDKARPLNSRSPEEEREKEEDKKNAAFNNIYP